MIDPALYSWHLSPATIALCSIAAAAALWLLCHTLRRLRLIIAKARDDEQAELTGTLPPVSVILNTGAHTHRLADAVESILAQQYPAPVEIIIVNTDGEEHTDTAIREIQTHHPQVRNTFVPTGSRNLSRRKLAITLGIKAATKPVVLLTAANAAPRSTSWLISMMRHFAQGADIVIGATTLRSPDSNRALGPTRSFDAMITAMRNIPAALAGKPVGADCANLAYRRQIFFDQKGFADTLNLNYGDDDIFVSDLAKNHTLAVELSPQAIIDTIEENPRRIYDMEKTSRYITNSRLRRAPFLTCRIATIIWWLWLLASIAASIAGLPSLLPLAAMIILAAAMLTPILILWRKAATTLRIASSAAAMLPMQLLRPCNSLMRKIKMGRNIRNYTWQN